MCPVVNPGDGYRVIILPSKIIKYSNTIINIKQVQIKHNDL